MGIVFLACGLVLFVVGARVGSDVPLRIGRRLGREGVEGVPLRDRVRLSAASTGSLVMVLLGLWLVLRGITLLLLA